MPRLRLALLATLALGARGATRLVARPPFEDEGAVSAPRALAPAPPPSPSAHRAVSKLAP
jgi:hypothetical protein